MKSIDSIIQIENRRGAEKVHKLYLKQLFNSIEIINSASDLPSSRSFISCTLGELEVVFQMLAGMLVHKDLTAVKMYQTDTLIIVEVIKNV